VCASSEMLGGFSGLGHGVCGFCAAMPAVMSAMREGICVLALLGGYYVRGWYWLILREKDSDVRFLVVAVLTL
jgi:hypothetical protein